jgi:hypothetical protein
MIKFTPAPKPQHPDINHGANGWEIKPGQNPYDRTPEEINAQLRQLCYRCGFNHVGLLRGFEEATGMNQYIHQGSLITKTNYKDMDKARDDKLRLVEPLPAHKRIPLDLL